MDGVSDLLKKYQGRLGLRQKGGRESTGRQPGLLHGRPSSQTNYRACFLCAVLWPQQEGTTMSQEASLHQTRL